MFKKWGSRDEPDDEDSFFDRSDFDFKEGDSGSKSSDGELESDRFTPNKMHLMLFSSTTMSDQSVAGVLRLEVNSEGLMDGNIVIRLKTTCRISKRTDLDSEVPLTPEELIERLRPVSDPTMKPTLKFMPNSSSILRAWDYIKNPKRLFASKILSGRFGTKKKDLKSMLENISSNKKRPGLIRKNTNLPTLSMPSETVLRTSAKDDKNSTVVQTTKGDTSPKKLMRVHVDGKSTPRDSSPTKQNVSIDDSQFDDEQELEDEWTIFTKEFQAFEIEKAVSKPTVLFIPFEIELEGSLVESDSVAELKHPENGGQEKFCFSTAHINHRVQAYFKPNNQQVKTTNIVTKHTRQSNFQDSLSTESVFHVHPKLSDLRMVPTEYQRTVSLSKMRRTTMMTPCMPKQLSFDCRVGLNTTVLYGKNSCLTVQLDVANKQAQKQSLRLEVIFYQSMKQNSITQEQEEDTQHHQLVLAKTISVNIQKFPVRQHKPVYEPLGLWTICTESTAIISERTILNMELGSYLKQLQTIKSSQICVEYYLDVFVSERPGDYTHKISSEEIRVVSVPKDARYLSSQQISKLWERARTASHKQDDRGVEIPFVGIKLKDPSGISRDEGDWDNHPGRI